MDAYIDDMDDKKRREKYMITYTIRNFITPLIDELAGAQG